jgi:hypothetical protein
VSREIFWGDDADSRKSNFADDVLWEAVLLAEMAQEDPLHPGTLDATLFKVLLAFDDFIKRQ